MLSPTRTALRSQATCLSHDPCRDRRQERMALVLGDCRACGDAVSLAGSHIRSIEGSQDPSRGLVPPDGRSSCADADAVVASRSGGRTRRREEDAVPLQTFIAALTGPNPPLRVPGTAIYFTTRPDVVPAALSLNLKHNGVVHEHLMLLKITTARVPKVGESERVTIKDLAPGIRQVEVTFGFAEKPDVPATLTTHADKLGQTVAQASFFLGREVPVPSLHPDVPLWQEKLYAFMTRNAVRAPDYLLIPPASVVELGTKVEM